MSITSMERRLERAAERIATRKKSRLHLMTDAELGAEADRICALMVRRGTYPADRPRKPLLEMTDDELNAEIAFLRSLGESDVTSP